MTETPSPSATPSRPFEACLEVGYLLQSRALPPKATFPLSVAYALSPDLPQSPHSHDTPGVPTWVLSSLKLLPYMKQPLLEACPCRST